MKSFTYTIKEPTGIHVRPAGMLAKIAKKFEGSIVLRKGDQTVDLSKAIALMSMGIKKGDSIVIEVSGLEEEKMCMEMEVFFQEKL